MQTDLIVEDLGGCARKRSQTGIPEALEEDIDRDAECLGALPHLERSESMDVHVGELGFDRLDDTHIEVTGELRMDAALEGHLGRTLVPCLLRPLHDLGDTHQIGIAPQIETAWPLRERTESAPEVAHVGVVDVAVDHVGDGLTDSLPAEAVGRECDRIHLIAPCPEQRLDLFHAGRRAVEGSLEDGTKVAGSFETGRGR